MFPQNINIINIINISLVLSTFWENKINIINTSLFFALSPPPPPLLQKGGGCLMFPKNINIINIINISLVLSFFLKTLLTLLTFPWFCFCFAPRPPLQAGGWGPNVS